MSNDKHKWECVSSGLYDSLYRCSVCGKERMESADNPATWLSITDPNECTVSQQKPLGDERPLEALSLRVLKHHPSVMYRDEDDWEHLDGEALYSEIADLEQRLAAAEAEKQQAIDAAFEHVAGLFDRVGKHDEAGFLRSWRGTNPLAERDARIAALEQRLEDANGVNKRDGNWMDKLGCCRVCDGEIPGGHTAECDYYKLEQRLEAAEAAWNNRHTGCRLSPTPQESPMTDELKPCKLTPKFNVLFNRWEVQDPRNAALSVEVDVQSAIDAALEKMSWSIMQYAGTFHCQNFDTYCKGRVEGLEDAARLCCSRLNSNPLAEAQARIAELEATAERANGLARFYVSDKEADAEGALIRQAQKIREMRREISDLTAQLAEARKDAGQSIVRALYDDLLLTVARKFPGETRHETALRYIRERESDACSQGADMKENAE